MVAAVADVSERKRWLNWEFPQLSHGRQYCGLGRGDKKQTSETKNLAVTGTCEVFNWWSLAGSNR